MCAPRSPGAPAAVGTRSAIRSHYRKPPALSREDHRMLKLAIQLDPAAVLRVVDDIDGDGSAALDAEALVALGLPRAFVEPLVEEVAASSLPA